MLGIQIMKRNAQENNHNSSGTVFCFYVKLGFSWSILLLKPKKIYFSIAFFHPEMWVKRNCFIYKLNGSYGELRLPRKCGLKNEDLEYYDFFFLLRDKKYFIERRPLGLWAPHPSGGGSHGDPGLVFRTQAGPLVTKARPGLRPRKRKGTRMRRQHPRSTWRSTSQRWGLCSQLWEHSSDTEFRTVIHTQLEFRPRSTEPPH